MKKLTSKRVDWIIARIEEWYSIREQYQQEGEVTHPSRSDVGHSALLWRLLSGEKALQYPPPRSFSYPNYNAAEGYEDKPMEVWFTGKDRFSPLMNVDRLLAGDITPGAVIIDQAAWDVIRRDGNTFFIKWKTDPAEWRLEQIPEKYRTHEKYYHWTLQRMVDDD